MPTYRDETERLRELHEDYAWQVNAAIGEDREDLVRKLSDEYLIKAMRLMTDEHLGAVGGLAGRSLGQPPRASTWKRLSGWFWRPHRR